MAPTVSDIKRAQKQRLLQREIASLFMKAQLDDPQLEGISITRVELSSDKSMCIVFMFLSGGQLAFDEKLKHLKLYKPSLRKSLADRLRFRYTPNLAFRYDALQEKEEEMNLLFEKLKGEGEL